MSLVVVTFRIIIYCWEGHSISTFGVDVISRSGEETRSSSGIIRCCSTIELHALYRVSRHCLIDTDTHLGAELTELKGHRIFFIAFGILGLLYRHEVSDVALAQVSSLTGESVGRPKTCSRRCGSNGGYSTDKNFTISQFALDVDGSLFTCRPSNKVILSLAVVPVFDGLAGDATIDGMFDALLTDIFPVSRVRLSGMCRVLNVLHNIVVEDNVTNRRCFITLVTRHHELISQQCCSLRTGLVCTGGLRSERAKRDGHFLLCHGRWREGIVDDRIIAAADEGQRCGSHEEKILFLHNYYY